MSAVDSSTVVSSPSSLQAGGSQYWSSAYTWPGGQHVCTVGAHTRTRAGHTCTWIQPPRRHVSHTTTTPSPVSARVA